MKDAGESEDIMTPAVDEKFNEIQSNFTILRKNYQQLRIDCIENDIFSIRLNFFL
jgi:hypothetical protein